MRNGESFRQKRGVEDNTVNMSDLLLQSDLAFLLYNFSNDERDADQMMQRRDSRRYAIP